MKLQAGITTLAIAFAGACSDGVTTAPPEDPASTAPSFAVGSSDNPNAAWVIHDGLCCLPGIGADGELGGAPGGCFTAQDYHKLQNNNKVLFSCSGEVTNLSGKAQVFRDFLCWVVPPKEGGGVFTDDTHATVSASGKANLKCKVDLSL